MIDLQLTSPQGHGASSQLKLDGVDVSAGVVEVTVTVGVDAPSQAVVTYACRSAEVEGVYEIVHFCPLKEES